MNARHFYAQIQVTGYLGRRDDTTPDRCVLCPRKQGPIANDRCLEYQDADHCLCPNAAITSARDQVCEDAELTRRRSLRRAARLRARRRLRVLPC